MSNCLFSIYFNISTLIFSPSTQSAYAKPADGFQDGEFPSFSNEFAADPFAGEDPFANETKQDDLFANEAFANAFGKSNTDVSFVDYPDSPVWIFKSQFRKFSS